jgi:hypothetical protein
LPPDEPDPLPPDVPDPLPPDVPDPLPPDELDDPLPALFEPALLAFGPPCPAFDEFEPPPLDDCAPLEDPFVPFPLEEFEDPFPPAAADPAGFPIPEPPLCEAPFDPPAFEALPPEPPLAASPEPADALEPVEPPLPIPAPFVLEPCSFSPDACWPDVVEASPWAPARHAAPTTAEYATMTTTSATPRATR